MGSFLAISFDYKDITFSCYVKEEWPGEVFNMVDIGNYVRLATDEELAILEEIGGEVEAVHFRLKLEAAERWPEWVPFMEEALQEIWPGEMADS